MEQPVGCAGAMGPMRVDVYTCSTWVKESVGMDWDAGASTWVDWEIGSARADWVVEEWGPTGWVGKLGLEKLEP